MNSQTETMDNTSGKQGGCLSSAWKTIKGFWNDNGKVKFIITALGIFLLYLYVGILQEQIMRGCYGDDSKDCKNGERFKFAVALVLVKTVCALIFISVFSLLSRLKKQDDTHFLYYAATGLAVTLAMVSSYMALRWVSFPTQVIFKSAKPLSVMVIGLFFCKRYTIQRYLFVVMIVVGVIVFKLFESTEGKEVKKDKKSEENNELIGILLLVLSLSMDGVLGAIQDKVRMLYAPTFQQMMLKMSLWSCAFLIIAVFATSEIFDVYHFICRHPEVIWHLLALGLTDAVGQLFIFIMISSFGALSCSVTTTVRKFFSVVFSVIFFGNPSTLIQWIGAACVFIGLLADAIFGKHKMTKKPVEHDANVEKGEAAVPEKEHGVVVPVEVINVPINGSKQATE